MVLKRIITKFIYRIEPKPEGGFIAHASDPSIPPLEAPTRLELQQKIQANISAALADRKSTRLNSSHTVISYAVFCLKKKKKQKYKLDHTNMAIAHGAQPIHHQMQQHQTRLRPRHTATHARPDAIQESRTTRGDISTN